MQGLQKDGLNMNKTDHDDLRQNPVGQIIINNLNISYGNVFIMHNDASPGDGGQQASAQQPRVFAERSPVKGFKTRVEKGSYNTVNSQLSENLTIREGFSPRQRTRINLGAQVPQPFAYQGPSPDFGGFGNKHKRSSKPK
jgi:hypothetical protein